MAGIAEMIALQQLMQQGRGMPGMQGLFGRGGMPRQQAPQAFDPDPFGYNRIQAQQPGMTMPSAGGQAGGGGGGGLKELIDLGMMLAML